MSAPASDSTASAAAASNISSCVARINRLRSARSPSAPAGTASSSTGMLAAAEIALTSRAEVVSESITHCAATVCIHEPMLLTNCADHSLLKSGSRIGAQPDPKPRGETFTLSWRCWAAIPRRIRVSGAMVAK